MSKKRQGGMCPKCGEKSAEITGQRYLCKKCGASGSIDEIIKKRTEELAESYRVATKIAIVHGEARKHLDANDREAAINIIASALELSREDAEQMVVNIETEDQPKASASKSGCAGVLLVVATAVSGGVACSWLCMSMS
jgi:predicted ATP-dependent serine protease